MAETPVFPNNLRLVRQARRLSIEAVAKELLTSPERLEKIEAGSVVPSERQFAAFEAIYGVPDYALAGQQEPALRPVAVDLRQSVAGPLQISPKGLKAYFAKTSLAELIDSLAESLQINPSKPRPSGYTISTLVKQVDKAYALLDFKPTDGRWIEEPDLALRYLRAKIEDFGIYCFLTAVPPADYRGLFTALSERAFLILINKRTFTAKARLFTLMHEFAHYLVGVQGASDPLVINNATEDACNKFASRFLLPESSLNSLLADCLINDGQPEKWIRYISRHSLLSQGAVAYRLRADGYLSTSEYKAWFQKNGLPPDFGGDPPEDSDGEVEESKGGNWAYNVVTDIGFRPFEILAKAMSQHVIDDVHVANIINARGETQAKAFKTAKDRKAELGL